MSMQAWTPVGRFVVYLYRKLAIDFLYFLFVYAAYKNRYGTYVDFKTADQERQRFEEFKSTFQPDTQALRSFEYSEDDAKEAVEYLASIYYCDFPLAYEDFTSELFRGAAEYDGYRRKEEDEREMARHQDREGHPAPAQKGEYTIGA